LSSKLKDLSSNPSTVKKKKKEEEEEEKKYIERQKNALNSL
jgi:hypothetical protein